MTDKLDLTPEHVTLSVADLAVCKPFYAKLLAPLGLELVDEVPADDAGVAHAGFGSGGQSTFWLSESGIQTPKSHASFRAQTRAQVREFHAAGLAAGGTDNGAPGVREEYQHAYYAAFVLDPEGHGIEAVCFESEPDDGSQ